MPADATQSPTNSSPEVALNERRFRALLEKSRDTVSLFDRASTIVYVSPSIQSLLGYSPEEYSRIPDRFDLLHPEDRAHAREQIKALLQSPGANITLKHRARHKTGEYRWIEAEITNLLDAPDVMAVLVNFRDTTESRQAEEQLKESEMRFRLMVENIQDIIAIYDTQGCFTYLSPAITRVLGYQPEELLGQSPLIFLHPEDVALAASELQKSVTGEYAALSGFRVQHKNGEWRFCEGSAKAVTDAEGNPTMIVSIIRDITERKRFEEERSQLLQRKDEFIGMASHELKTPVTSLKGFTQLLLQRNKLDSDAETLRFLTRMDVQLNKLTQLINDLLDISRMQAGQIEYRAEPFELDGLVCEIVENMQGITSTHRITLAQCDKAAVFGDRDRVSQVLINLLTNAIKYSSKAEEIIVRLMHMDEEAIVSVQDFGIGIGKDHQQKIFERFYQVSEFGPNTYPGLGIGLYISSEIIKRHHGRIWVESVKGQGATFSFALPLL